MFGRPATVMLSLSKHLKPQSPAKNPPIAVKNVAFGVKKRGIWLNLCPKKIFLWAL